MTEQAIIQGPVEVITLSEFRQRKEHGQTVTPGTMLLLPVQIWQEHEQMWQAYRTSVGQIFEDLREGVFNQFTGVGRRIREEQALPSDEGLGIPTCADAALIYEHTLCFETDLQAATAKETLLTRKPLMLDSLSIEVRDGNPSMDLYTKERLDASTQFALEHALRPATSRFNVEVSEAYTFATDILPLTKVQEGTNQ